MVMTRILGPACLVLLLAGPAAPARAGHRPADEIVGELEGLIANGRRALPTDQFVRNHARKAELVEELARAYLDDPRLARFLPERWLSLCHVGRKEDARAEVAEALRTARDPALAAEARFAAAGLVLTDPISAAEAAAA